MGELRLTGWFAFFPVLIAVKLPLAFLLLMLTGLIWRPQRPSEYRPYLIAVAVPAAILAVAIYPANINIGIRHIMPSFPFYALIATAGSLWLLRSEQKWAGWALGIAFLWMCGSSLAIHPDYLAYFNEIAGSEPDKIVVDSDLDFRARTSNGWARACRN